MGIAAKMEFSRNEASQHTSPWLLLTKFLQSCANAQAVHALSPMDRKGFCSYFRYLGRDLAMGQSFLEVQGFH